MVAARQLSKGKEEVDIHYVVCSCTTDVRAPITVVLPYCKPISIYQGDSPLSAQEVVPLLVQLCLADRKTFNR